MNHNEQMTIDLRSLPEASRKSLRSLVTMLLPLCDKLNDEQRANTAELLSKHSDGSK